MRLRKRHLLSGEVIEFLEHKTLAFRLLLIAAIAVFSAGLHLLAVQIYYAVKDRPVWMVMVAGLALTFAGLFLLQVLAGRLMSGVLAIHAQPSRNCRALILFVSPSGDPLGEKRLTEGHKDLKDKRPGDFLDHYAGSPWRDALLAVQGHVQGISRDRLRVIALVPSAEAGDYEARFEKALARNAIPNDSNKFARLLQADPAAARDLAVRRGTHACVHHFRDLLKNYVKALNGPELTIYSAVSLGWEQGVSFERAGDLAACVNDVFNDLRENHHIRASDVVVDITGGVALCAAVGAAVSLERNQRFQYVNRDGEILCYDMEYAPPEH